MNLPVSEIATMRANGRVTDRDIQELIEYENYMNVQTAPKAYAGAEFAKLVLCGYRLSTEGAGATGEAAKRFGRNCFKDELTRGNIEQGIYAWERKDTGFAPTYGQFLAGIKYRQPEEQRGRHIRALKSLLEVSAND